MRQIQYVRRVTINDADYDLPSITLKRAWNKLWPHENNEENKDEGNNNIDYENILHLCVEKPTEENIKINDVVKRMNVDKLDAGFEFLSNDELIQIVLN